MRNRVGTLLVVSNDEEQCKKFVDRYSRDANKERYVKETLETAAKGRKMLTACLYAALSEPRFPFNDRSRENAEEMLRKYASMTDLEFFQIITDGFDVDVNTLTAYAEGNPDGKYSRPVCYQDRLIENGEEGPLSVPFTLLDGTKSYSARLNDIDWSVMHGANIDIYRAAYELCFEGREPSNRQEEGIVSRMSNRLDYFGKFTDKDEYAKYSTSFSANAVITDDGEYHSRNCFVSRIEWAINFYRFFIEAIDGNPLLTIYEIENYE